MIKKLILLPLLAIGLVMVAYFVGSHFSKHTAARPDASHKGLIVNYTLKKREIEKLRDYYTSISVDSLQVYVEFHDENDIDFIVKNKHQNTEGPGQPPVFGEWSVNPYQYKQEEGIAAFNKSQLTFSQTCRLLGWDANTFKKIKQLLDNANCISIQNGEPVNIGFQRVGFGKYFYNIFERRIADKYQYNDSCKYIFYNDSVVLEYGGGAVGPQCFPDPDPK